VINFRGELGFPPVVLRGAHAKPIASIRHLHQHPSHRGCHRRRLLAGRELRKRHLASQPYDVYSVEEDHPADRLYRRGHLA